MFIQRILETKIKEAATEYPVLAIMGPRQSGKTTLARKTFPSHTYVSLEDFDIRNHALSDPRGFLESRPSLHGIILDEIQHAPDLLSYIQTIVDSKKLRGFFILTGSQNFLVTQTITQTLPGRMAVVTLLPLSIAELQQSNHLPNSINSLIFRGSYPRLYAEALSIERLYTNYIELYVERDVRSVINIQQLHLFQKFIRLCAGRIGQIINYASLANDCGINEKTAKTWLSLLEASYIIFQLHPYFNNYGKRLIKSPKLYFVDTGLACALLNITNEEMLSSHYARGGLVESLLIGDFLKQQYNYEQRPSLYFWRDVTGNEIDCIIDRGVTPTPIEIKASSTLAYDFFTTIKTWSQDRIPPSTPYLIYTGTTTEHWSNVTALGWKDAGSLIERLDLT